jgi:hypothetical protein
MKRGFLFTFDTKHSRRLESLFIKTAVRNTVLPRVYSEALNSIAVHRDKKDTIASMRRCKKF